MTGSYVYFHCAAISEMNNSTAVLSSQQRAMRLVALYDSCIAQKLCFIQSLLFYSNGVIEYRTIERLLIDEHHNET